MLIGIGYMYIHMSECSYVYKYLYLYYISRKKASNIIQGVGGIQGADQSI
jgi:hypothetical protein